jgi:hypothetical protein
MKYEANLHSFNKRIGLDAIAVYRLQFSAGRKLNLLLIGLDNTAGAEQVGH